jgi:hypothetical protein
VAAFETATVGEKTDAAPNQFGWESIVGGWLNGTRVTPAALTKSPVLSPISRHNGLMSDSTSSWLRHMGKTRYVGFLSFDVDSLSPIA